MVKDSSLALFKFDAFPNFCQRWSFLGLRLYHFHYCLISQLVIRLAFNLGQAEKLENFSHTIDIRLNARLVSFKDFGCQIWAFPILFHINLNTLLTCSQFPCILEPYKPQLIRAWIEIWARDDIDRSRGQIYMQVLLFVDFLHQLADYLSKPDPYIAIWQYLVRVRVLVLLNTSRDWVLDSFSTPCRDFSWSWSSEGI